MADQERCRPLLDDDGHLVAMVRGAKEPSEQARRALLDVVAAAKRRMAEEDPDGLMAARQAAAIERIRMRVRARSTREDTDHA